MILAKEALFVYRELLHPMGERIKEHSIQNLRWMRSSSINGHE